MKHIYPVLLCGDSGTRLWPLSRKSYPKQFVPLVGQHTLFQDTAARLDNLEDPYRLFRCHTIMNCVDVCPKNLNPTRAIGKIKEMIVRRTI